MSETEFDKVEGKKGGPYSAKERRLRREHVAELYFEKGISAVNISRILNVNRNTVMNDLNVCYAQLKKENADFDPTTICMTQFHRMQIQRARFVDLLNNDLEFRDRLNVEKMISDMEYRLMQTALKIKTSSENVVNHAIQIFNMWAKKQNPTFRGISSYDVDRLSVDAHEKVDKIIQEDREKTCGFTY